MKEQILKDYDNKKIIFIELEEKIKGLINSLIKEQGLTIHGIESRVKQKESLSKKIDEKGDKYNGLEEITDTLGLRIITYFEDDVDKIANLIKTEFLLDEKNSTDKRDKKPDTFGYSSLHYIVKLKEPRASLPEYARFNDINFELQIRSILQHAWAEIEHDIGYKSAISIPKNVRRNFSRIASLLELADIEFIRIKKEIQKYSEKVKENIKLDNLNIPLDKVTLEEFLENSSLISEINYHFKRLFNAVEVKYSDRAVESDLKRLMYFNITTLEQLQSELFNRKDKILSFSAKWVEKNAITISKGVALFYLEYLLIGEKNDVNAIEKYLQEFSIGQEYRKTAEKILRVINEM
ncbi:GTP pyrophosphokinase family protein [Heyndrickxia acidicola]|uniref:RelA/SpoT domain-containing protein n=1 Tax=Heyndrickxia acidicola TaxID=209389 RepID=A0ABU6MBB3_9BACI|nr:hypothetical protein [Heyndrickxia acidicola]MED1201968.1 hypothetical protein [Heyndrickxia acidicola]